MVGPGDLERVPCFVTCRYIMGICSNIIIISTLLFDVIIGCYVATVLMMVMGMTVMTVMVMSMTVMTVMAMSTTVMSTTAMSC